MDSTKKFTKGAWREGVETVFHELNAAMGTLEMTPLSRALNSLALQIGYVDDRLIDLDKRLDAIGEAVGQIESPEAVGKFCERKFQDVFQSLGRIEANIEAVSQARPTTQEQASLFQIIDRAVEKICDRMWREFRAEYQLAPVAKDLDILPVEYHKGVDSDPFVSPPGRDYQDGTDNRKQTFTQFNYINPPPLVTEPVKNIYIPREGATIELANRYYSEGAELNITTLPIDGFPESRARSDFFRLPETFNQLVIFCQDHEGTRQPAIINIHLTGHVAPEAVH